MAATEPQVQQLQQFTAVDDYCFSGDSVTVSNKRAFVEAYRVEGTIFHAARIAGIARYTVYRYIDSDPVFAEAVADSKEDSLDDLETSVYRRAFSDNLLAMFYLKAHRPKFRDKVAIDVQVIDEEIRQRLSALQAQRVLPPMMVTIPNDSGDDNQDSGLLSLPIPPQPDDQQKD